MDLDTTDSNQDSWVLQAESTGELFLRKAGVNTFAAGVILREISRLDSEDPQGPVGVMRRLLVMGSDARKRLLEGLVSEMVVDRLSLAVERVWRIEHGVEAREEQIQRI